MGRPIKDITGNVYNSLKVIGEGYRTDKGLLWECICSCGNTTYVQGADLKRGHNKTCGNCEGKSLDSAINVLFKNYNRGAKNRNLNFNLTFEYFKEKIFENCVYCGSEPLQEFNKEGLKQSFFYNGLDRIDNSEGYTEKNTETCCKFCNFAKNKSTKEEFYQWIKRLVNYENNRNK